MSGMRRRKFIKAVIGGSSVFILPLDLEVFTGFDNRKISFGVCADVHKNVLQDADE
jgi:hypothetical protein